MSYHNQMMNIRIPESEPRANNLNYKIGHKDARHAAAEIAQRADNTIEDLVDITQTLLEALEGTIKGKVHSSESALHPSKLFCDVCGRNSDEHVHFFNCPVFAAENAIAKAKGKANE